MLRKEYVVICQVFFPTSQVSASPSCPVIWLWQANGLGVLGPYHGLLQAHQSQIVHELGELVQGVLDDFGDGDLGAKKLLETMNYNVFNFPIKYQGIKCTFVFPNISFQHHRSAQIPIVFLFASFSCSSSLLLFWSPTETLKAEAGDEWTQWAAVST